MLVVFRCRGCSTYMYIRIGYVHEARILEERRGSPPPTRKQFAARLLRGGRGPLRVAALATPSTP